jgi:hypothetical protein
VYASYAVRSRCNREVIARGYASRR